VPHSHVGAPAQILHGNLMLARHSIVFCRIAFVQRNERHQDTGLSMVCRPSSNLSTVVRPLRIS
jgi:hypothetical protein